MEEEIDLRFYVEVLLARWYWIVGAAVLAAVSAFIFLTFTPPTYEATALVSVGEPSQLALFDPRTQDIAIEQPLEAYPELALSDKVLQELLTAVALPEITTIEQLRKTVSAEAGADPSLLRLTVTYDNRESAAEIANQWAEILITALNDLYGDTDTVQLAIYQRQFEQAEQDLSDAEQALIDFQARNRMTTLENELTALNQTQTDYFAKQGDLALLIQDVQSLRDQLAQQESDPNFGDQLNSLLLQVRTFNQDFNNSEGSTTAVTLPFQLQINSDTSVSDFSREEQISFLDSLLTTLSTRLEQLDEALAELEPKILTLQQQKQEMETQELQLTLNRDVIIETYTALSRKIVEQQVASQDSNSGIKLASDAAVPSEPEQNTLIIVLLAAIVAAFLTIGAIWMMVWWRGDYDDYMQDSIEQTETTQQQFSTPLLRQHDATD